MENQTENEVVEKETAGVGTQPTQKRKVDLKKRFSAKRIALMAVFVALSFAVSLLSFSLFPSTPVFFLELDFGNVFILLISFLLGPVEGVIVCILKELLRTFVGSTGGVGEIANMITTSAYILLPSIVYQFRKGIKTVAWTLGVACLIGTAVALVTNRFITFPWFLHENGATTFAQGFWLIVAFNLIKTTAISVLTLLLYKRLSNFLKKMKI